MNTSPEKSKQVPIIFDGNDFHNDVERISIQKTTRYNCHSQFKEKNRFKIYQESMIDRIQLNQRYGSNWEGIYIYANLFTIDLRVMHT